MTNIPPADHNPYIVYLDKTYPPLKDMEKDLVHIRYSEKDPKTYFDEKESKDGKQN